MGKKKRIRKIGLLWTILPGIFFLLIGLQYGIIGNPGSVEPLQRRWSTDGGSAEKPVIVAHRGVHHNYQKGVYDVATGCEAKHILPPTHFILENTLESICAAFTAGAEIVEIDIRKTADDHLVVFHDYDLSCRTDGKGYIWERDLEYLHGLDIGYGYTPDGGQSFPLRGKGIGKMITLQEALEAFPQGSFLIDHKDGTPKSTEILMDILGNRPYSQRSRLWYWGPPETLDDIQETFPEVRRLFMLRWQIKKVGVPFFISFGAIGIPEEYQGLAIGIPSQYVKWVWGWPYRFINTLHQQGTGIFLYVDSTEEAEKYKEFPVDGFVTDYIEITGPILQGAQL